MTGSACRSSRGTRPHNAGYRMPTPTLATYSFLPWLRRGMASHIARRDGEASADVHVRVPIGLSLNTNLTVTVPLALRGPGEVASLDRDVIARVYPTPNTFDVESNYFPLIEFEQPDLPWRYTPARDDAANRLRPWLCLITLADDEVDAFEEAGGEGLPPVLTVGSAAVLPKLDQSWVWAHVQVSGEDAQDLDAAALHALLSAHPQRAVARLLSPRRLVPNRIYRAFLVPAFERGRLAGLGEEPHGDGLVPAWTSTSSDIRLPVYHHWRFGTGVAGDFEYLARQLQARPLPHGVGTRPIDVGDAGLGLPPAADAPMLLEGALVPPLFARPPWNGAVAEQFRNALAGLLNLPAARLSQTNQSRIVGPPLYGRWHARRERLASQPPWFPTLNVDPRNRVMGGAGTRVVQILQRQLMASAWQQVAGVREANERLRFAQLARAAADRIFVRHVSSHETDVLLGVTAPLHAKVLASPTTIAERLRTSPVAPGSLAPQLRRVARPLGPLGRRLGLADRRQPPRIVDRLNRGDLVLAPPPVLPAGAITPESAVVRGSAEDTPERRGALGRRARALMVAALVFLALALIAILAGAGLLLVLALAGAAAAAFAGARAINRRLAHVDRLDALAAGTLTPEMIASVPRRSEFVPSESAPSGGGQPPPPSGPAAPGGERPSVARFREAATEVFRELSTPPFEPPPLVTAPLADLHNTLTASLRPEITFAASLQGRLKLPPLVARQPGTDPLEPVMASPQFPQAMYKPLADLSQDWLLPGLERVPQNTTTLVETNQSMIEGYMVGLGHEMARELQWNEYPTDMRGTYFRQFWDVAAYAGNVPPEKLRDIKEIHTWVATGLGENSARDLPPSGRHLVLLVRGELLRRYPNTVVYAVKTTRDGGGRALGPEERHPLFRGTLPPDVTFFGFDLTVEDVRGVDEPQSPHQGWYFVFQEQPSEPRFGLDVATGALGGIAVTWSDLSWGHLAASEPDLAALTYIDVDANLPDTRQVSQTGGAAWHAASGLGPAGATAAHLAYITLQQPMRVALHGSDMIRSN